MEIMAALLVYLLLTMIMLTGGDWCDLDTGYTTIVDGRGVPHSVYISAARGGGVWLRAGRDHKAQDWLYEREGAYWFKDAILDGRTVQMLQSLNYTDHCVLSDLELRIQMDAGWHPSWVKAFDPRTKDVSTVHPRHSRDCSINTSLTLTPDKQGLFCDGGKSNACGLRNLPAKGHSSQPVFLKEVNLDPGNPDRWICKPVDEMRNAYRFVGSYYHAYIKLASCPLPTDSRVLGHEAKLRPARDTLTNALLIPDPTQMALNGGVIVGWQAFAKIISIQHEVYLQVWRPDPDDLDTYTLVGQTFFRPTELRFQEVPLTRGQYIRMQRGDVLGLYFPKQHPIAWSAVPCAFSQQHYKVLHNPGGPITVGASRRLYSALPGPAACRHYSFTAVLANKTHSKLIEDWICPTAQAPAELRKRSDHVAAAGGGGREGQQQRSPGYKMLESGGRAAGGGGAGVAPYHLALIIVGCLALLLVVLGVASYYKALHS